MALPNQITMKKRNIITYVTLVALIFITFWVALTNGASHFSIFKMNATQLNTIFNIRLPRIIAAFIAGAALSVSGAFFQGALRNPIADPGFMGISAGASLFQFIGALILPSFLTGQFLMAFIGGFLALFILIHFQPRMNPYRLILIGVALNATFTGIQEVFPVSQGRSNISLSTITWTSTFWLVILGIIGLMAAIIITPWCNYLKVNDAQLGSLGISASRLRSGLLAVAVFLATTVTVSAGVILFIGIIIPHIGRWLLGHDYRHLIPFSILAGGWMLLFADTLGRLIIQPSEIPAATILIIIGGPFLIFILSKQPQGDSTNATS